MNLLVLIVYNAIIALASDCSFHQVYDWNTDSCIDCNVVYPDCFTCEIVEYDLVTDGGFEDHNQSPRTGAHRFNILPAWTSIQGDDRVIDILPEGNSVVHFGCSENPNAFPTFGQQIKPLPGYLYDLSFDYLEAESDCRVTIQDTTRAEFQTLELEVSDTWRSKVTAMPRDWKELYFSADCNVNLDNVTVKLATPSIKYEIIYSFAPSSSCNICNTRLCRDCDCSYTANNPSPPILKCYGGIKQSDSTLSADGLSPSFCTKLTS